MFALANKNEELAKQHLIAAAQNSHIEAQALIVAEIFEFPPEFVKEIEAEFYKQDEKAFIEMQKQAFTQ